MNGYHECQRELWKIEYRLGAPEWGNRINCTCDLMETKAIEDKEDETWPKSRLHT